MPEPVLAVLKLCALALLYLFFLRVLRAVWAEVRAPAMATAPAGGSAPAGRRERKRGGGAPALVVVAPEDQKGRRYDLTGEATVGRAPGCQVSIEDSYISQIHARVYQGDGSLFVEDLGSTNGTFVNDRPVTRPTALRRGDRLRLGGVILEVRT